MEDSGIVDLYWERDESAIRETALKYSNYLRKIAYNILYDTEDSMECENDTYLKAWNSMPPHRPAHLSAYLGKIIRNLSIDVFRRKSSAKRPPSEFALSLSELEDCVGTGDSAEENLELKLLAGAISEFLRGISQDARRVFVCRYFYADSIQEIASWTGYGESRIKSMLHRTRLGLRSYLEKEGFVL